MPLFICETPIACSFEALAISPTSSATFATPFTILSNALAVSLAILVPNPTFLIAPSIRSVVSFAASALLAARFLYVYNTSPTIRDV